MLRIERQCQRSYEKVFEGHVSSLRLATGSHEFASINFFNEVRRGFKFIPNSFVFYPPVSFSRKHNKDDSIFNVALAPFIGTDINDGTSGPFGYACDSRPPSEDTSATSVPRLCKLPLSVEP